MAGYDKSWVHWAPDNSSAETEIRGLLRGVMGLHSTFTDEIWLWRGQADAKYQLEPGMHSRVKGTDGIAHTEENARWATDQLIHHARDNELDRLDDLRLPDLALLAHLQHHGAATPLLDVTVDPLVGLWMAVNASGSSAEALDKRPGLLFAIRRPPADRWVEPLDSRDYYSEGARGNFASWLGDGVAWFRPPDVSERLRIQRGSFLTGPLADAVGSTSLPLTYRAGKDWLSRRVKRIGKTGQPARAETEIAVFRIRAGLKVGLREWLSQRAGLTREAIYPTPWHRPFLDQFCTAYGRGRSVDFK